MPKLPTYLLILTTAFLLSGCSWFKKPVTNDQQPVTQLSPTPTPPETQLPPEERPIITMKPDAKIQNIELKILEEELDNLEDWQRILLLMRSQEIPYSAISKFVNKPKYQLKVYYARLKKLISEKINKQLNTTKAEKNV